VAHLDIIAAASPNRLMWGENTWKIKWYLREGSTEVPGIREVIMLVGQWTSERENLRRAKSLRLSNRKC